LPERNVGVIPAGSTLRKRLGRPTAGANSYPYHEGRIVATYLFSTMYFFTMLSFLMRASGLSLMPVMEIVVVD
jgi:hypothetical protein